MDSLNLGQLTKETVVAEYARARHRGLERFKEIARDSMVAAARGGRDAQDGVAAIVKGALMGLGLTGRDAAVGAVEIVRAAREAAELLGVEPAALIDLAVKGLVAGRLFLPAEARRALLFELHGAFPDAAVSLKAALADAEASDDRARREAARVEPGGVDRFNLAGLAEQAVVEGLKDGPNWSVYRRIVSRSLGAAAPGNGAIELRDGVAAVVQGAVTGLLVLELDLPRGALATLGAVRGAAGVLGVDAGQLLEWAVLGFVRARRLLGADGLRRIKVELLREAPSLARLFDEELARAEIAPTA